MKAEELAYWYWLSSVKGIGPIIFKKLLDNLESPLSVFNSDESVIVEKAGIRKSLAHNIDLSKKALNRYFDFAERQIKIAEYLNGHILTSDEFPSLNLHNENNSKASLPPIIHALGDTKYLEGRKLAIVGTRNPSDEGRRNTFNVAFVLVKERFIVVSGLALGIDAEAHKGALKAGGGTVAVLGSGADIIYPPNNSKIYRDILTKGLIISEFPFGTRPSSENLRKRNRTIVTLSEAVIVAECPLRSGSMIAARFAAEQRKPIFSFKCAKTTDNTGGDWLIKKCLAVEWKEQWSGSISNALIAYEAPAHINKLFLEIWPKKSRIEPRDRTLRKGKKSTKTSQRLGKIHSLPESASRQQKLLSEFLSSSETPMREQVEAFPFRKGDDVQHVRFGEGRIIKIVEAGGDYQITVKFLDKKSRTFSWKLANLAKI